MSLDPREARAWAERWRLVAEAEREELRSMTMEDKLRRLEALMASARAMGWTGDAAEDEAVRARWLKLIERLGG